MAEDKQIKPDHEREYLNLKGVIDNISSMVLHVIRDGLPELNLAHPNISPCYEQMNCAKKDCPCYGKGPVRCWHEKGTYCDNNVQGDFLDKFGYCMECLVLKNFVSDPIACGTEQFYNLLQMIVVKNRKLEQAYEDLKTTQSRLLQQEKMASIGQLAAGVAHEINNPIGFITSNLGTLEKYVGKFREFICAQNAVMEALAAPEADSVLELRRNLKIDHILEDVSALIKESLDGVVRVKSIVQDLRSFSRIDEAEFKRVDINECIESTLNIVWNELKYKATVKKDYGKLPLTECYPQQLNQMFMNLFVNAAQAIEKQGEITIRTWNGSDAIHISISDTGSGIPKDKLGRIFEPFYTTRAVGKGMGLGLSIAYGIVKKHNGCITVESEIGKGTTFNIQIPMVDEKRPGRDA